MNNPLSRPRIGRLGPAPVKRTGFAARSGCVRVCIAAVLYAATAILHCNAAAGAEMGLFEQTADWGAPQFPPRVGEFKTPGRMTVGIDDGAPVYDIHGNGDDIMVTDEAFFAYLEREGSWKLSGRIEWIDRGGSSPYAQAGLMIREEGESSSSNFISILYHAGRGPDLGWTAEVKWRAGGAVRASAHLVSALTPRPGSAIHFRLTRIATGQLVGAEWSYEGSEWHTAFSLAMPMRGKVAYGLVVTNVKDNERLAHARFSDVKFEPVTAEAVRRFGAEDYWPGEPVPVEIEIVNPSDRVLNVSLTETLPPGWIPVDAGGGKIVSGNQIHWASSTASATGAFRYAAEPLSPRPGFSLFRGAFGRSRVLGSDRLPSRYLRTRVNSPSHWRSWTHEDGLAESYTHTMNYARGDGVLWINRGGADMVLFDGYRMEPRPGPGPIAKFLPGVDGSAWAVFQESKNDPIHLKDYLIDPRIPGGRWRLHPEFGTDYPDYLLTMSGPRFLRLDGGRVLILEPDRLKVYHLAEETFETVKTVSETDFTLFIGVCRGGGGAVWVACREGLARMKPGAAGGFEWEEFPIPPEARVVWYSNIAEKNGTVWGNGRLMPGNRQVVLRFDGEWGAPVYLPDEDVEFIAAGGDGGVWVRNLTTMTLSRFKGQYVESIDESLVLTSALLDAESADGDRFFLSTAQGIVTHAPPTWRTPIEIKSASLPVTSIHADADGTLWLAGTNEILRRGPGGWRSIPLPDGCITHWLGAPNLFPLPDGRLGVRVKDKQGARRLLSPRMLAIDTEAWDADGGEPFPGFDSIAHPANYGIGPVAPAPGGALWTTSMRYERWRLERFGGRTFETVIEDLRIGYLRSIYADSRGRLWICGSSGLACYRDGEYILPAADNGFPSGGDGVNTVCEICPGVIWVGSEDRIWQYDGYEWSVVLRGVISVMSIFAAAPNDIWVGTANGVYRHHRGFWMSNTTADGLPHNTVSMVAGGGPGEVWAAGMKGASLHHPEADRDPPRSSILASENMRDIAPGGEVRIVYQGTDRWKYTHASRLLYSYDLDGAGWSPWTANTLFSATGLAAGAHRFRVRAIDRNWNVETVPAEWEFRVLLPWYGEPAFLGISLLGALLTLFFAGLAVQYHLKLRISNVDLQNANRELMELNQMKSAFFSKASHDFRTPLTAVKSSLDNLSCGAAGELNDTQRKIIGMASVSLNRLTKMVNDVLDLNRIETGRVELNKRPLTLEDLADRAVREFRPAAEQKPLTLEWRSVGGPFEGLFDPQVIERVFRELVHNAIKYTPEGGRIEVSLRRENGAAVFSVRDTGIGIDPAEIKKIWEPFYRAHAARHTVKGSGLGLSIVRELLELHGGAIRVDSRPGGGTLFEVELPLPSEAPAAESNETTGASGIQGPNPGG